MKDYKPTVLIIDDVQENIQVLGTLLEKHNIEIAATSSGKQGIEIASQIPVDLILLDIMMPDMNGFDVCRRLKTIEKTKNIPVIFITAKSDTEDIVAGFESGGVDHITKPIKEKEVLARVATHLELKRYQDHLEELVKAKTIELEKAKFRAEAANEAKTRFLVNVHHELKTPMTGIMGMNAILLETNLDDEQKDYVETMETSANAMLTVINDVLHFTEAMHGQIHLEICKLGVESIVKDIYDILTIRAREKKIELIYKLDENIPGVLAGDPGRLRQILMNICGNALKFTEKGKVKISVRLTNETQNNCRLSFEVADTGIGILENQMEKLFKPFSQLDDTLTRQYGGLGLGLINARNLIEMMGGDITVKSVFGEGTTFTFSVNLLKI
ncbi:MAG: response regulator [Proteobacteria bacterium]|nr:response regulator [Pseudomonadota bacterium]